MTKDMTKGSIWQQILLFTLPLMAGNFLQQIYSLADGLVAGNMIGSDALSAIGIVFPLTFLLVAAATGLTNGCGVIVAQYFGANDIKRLRKSVSTTILTVLGVAVVITILGYLLSHPILAYILNTPDALMPMAMTYMRIYCAGLIFQFVYNAMAAILRALGDSKSTLYFLIIATILNVVLDIALARPFGIAGIAWATVTAQGCSALASVLYLFIKVTFLRYGKGEFRFDTAMFRLAMKMGVPTTIQQLCVGLGMVLMQRLINSFGTEAISATTAAMRVESFAMVPIMMFFQGLANFTGQNMGAGKLDRVKKGYHQTMVMALICCGLIIAIVLGTKRLLMTAFALEGESMLLGTSYLRGLMTFFVIFCVMYVTNGVLQGSGDVMYPTAASITSLAVRVISANIMANVLNVGYASIYIAIPIGWAAGTVIVVLRYLTGKWKTKAVVRK